MMNNSIQALIFALSSAAIYLVGSNHWKTRRTGSVIGLLAQPLWFHTSYSNQQWGIIALTAWYTFCWIRGIRNNNGSK